MDTKSQKPFTSEPSTTIFDQKVPCTICNNTNYDWSKRFSMDKATMCSTVCLATYSDERIKKRHKILEEERKNQRLMGASAFSGCGGGGVH
jgi:hypothetical protein